VTAAQLTELRGYARTMWRPVFPRRRTGAAGRIHRAADGDGGAAEAGHYNRRRRAAAAPTRPPCAAGRVLKARLWAPWRAIES